MKKRCHIRPDGEGHTRSSFCTGRLEDRERVFKLWQNDGEMKARKVLCPENSGESDPHGHGGAILALVGFLIAACKYYLPLCL